MANFWTVAFFNRLLPGVLYFSYLVLWFNAVTIRLPGGRAWISHTLPVLDRHHQLYLLYQFPFPLSLDSVLIIRYVYYHYQNETKPLKALIDLKSLLFGTVVHGSLKRHKTLNSDSLSHNYPITKISFF